jgi:hypothetical protein
MGMERLFDKFPDFAGVSAMGALVLGNLVLWPQRQMQTPG